ncbi:MAG: NAD(P)-dependent oxidoreductase [Chloroflexi bacterium]|nr:NAD(P)-dependent oxidoreductase [Chloroflexota bacterium]
MRVIVTGTSGFIGPFVAARFVQGGHNVTGLDLRPRPLDPRHEAPPIQIVEADILDRQRVREIVDEVGAEGIVHAVALISQVDGASDPLRTFQVNVEGTMSVLEAARQRGLRVVYISTATLYGIHPDLHPLGEDARPEPVGIYDTTKLMAETMAITYHKVYGLDTAVVRPGYVFGPNSSTGGYFLDRALAGEAIDEPVGADLPMDLTYVRDLAEGVYRAMTVRPITHRIFNVTGGALRRRHEVAEVVRQLVPEARITVGPGLPPRAHLRGPCILTRARLELGYEPRYTLETGMADWLRWLQTACG